MIDDETHTYWDHITGEAVHGELAGQRLPVWPTTMTTVAGALAKDPDLQLSRSRPPLLRRLFGHLMHRFGSIVRLPPGFRATMGETDARLPEWTHGLGVVNASEARYYPIKSIGKGVDDTWGDRHLRITIDNIDHVPCAQWSDGTRPMQLFSRWYGFSLTYPGTGIYRTGHG